MMNGEDDWWRFYKNIATLPLIFSIKTIKE